MSHEIEESQKDVSTASDKHTTLPLQQAIVANTHIFPLWTRAMNVLLYTPQRCRYDPAHPPVFSLALNLLFGFAATFTVANLYYNHPILNILAVDFGVTYERASLVPTLAQAGYAGGLLFLCPLGDRFPRRPFVLWLVLLTAAAW